MDKDTKIGIIVLVGILGFFALFIGGFVLIEIFDSPSSQITGSTIGSPSASPKPKIKWKEKTIKDEVIVVKPGYIFYSGGSYESKKTSTKYHYVVSSSNPVDIFIVASESDYKLLVAGEEFVHYPACRGVSVLKYDRECTISDDGGIAIKNNGKSDAVVNLKISYLYPKII